MVKRRKEIIVFVVAFDRFTYPMGCIDKKIMREEQK